MRTAVQAHQGELVPDLFLGYTRQQVAGPVRPVWLDSHVRRNTHMMVLGTPGSGKSKLLEHMIREDIRAQQGLMLLDIHGTLFDAVRDWCGFRHYVDRPLVILDPSHGDFVKGFNPFRRRRDAKGELIDLDVQVSGMVEALLRVWGATDTNQTPTLDRVLRLLFTAMLVRSIPLHEAFALVDFHARRFRQDVIESFDESPIRAAWTNLAAAKRLAEWRDEVLSTENRLFRLVTSPTVCRFMGVMDDGFNIDPTELMDQGAVVLVNLRRSGKLSRDNGRAFAALLLNDFFQSAMMCRSKDPRPFYCYVDEWQEVVTPDIGIMLKESRKFGMPLVLATQMLSQIKQSFGDPFVDTLVGCCQIKACFGGLNRADATRMVQEMVGSELGLDETKYELESTKFWPTLGRETVTSRGRSSTRTRGRGEIEGAGQTSHFGFRPDEDGVMNLVDAAAYGEGSSSMLTRGISESVSEGETESEADVPMIIPEPFTEVSSRVVYSLEEQIWRWAVRFMEQQQRHCYVKLPDQPILPLAVPEVRQRWVGDYTIAQYVQRIAEQTNSLPAAAVDELITRRTRALTAGSSALAVAVDDDDFE